MSNSDGDWGYRDHRRDDDPGDGAAPPAPSSSFAPPPPPPPPPAEILDAEDWEPHFGIRFHRGPRAGRPAPEVPAPAIAAAPADPPPARPARHFFPGMLRDQWPARWAETARRYEAGESAPQIARAMGIRRETVLARLEAMGVARRRAGDVARARILAPIDDAELLRLRAGGMVETELAAHFSVSQQTISRRLISLRRAAAELPAPEVLIDPAGAAPPPEVPAAPPSPAIAAAPPPSWDGPAGWRTCELDEAELVRLYVTEGLTLRAAAARLEVDTGTVRRRLHALGVAVRPAGRRPRAGPSPDLVAAQGRLRSLRRQMKDLRKRIAEARAAVRSARRNRDMTPN